MSVSASNPNPDGYIVQSPTFVGKRVGPYVICLELGSGGMAAVFLARSTQTDGPRFIALKAIHQHLAAQRDFVEMFVDEASITSQIRHRNICEVYGLDFVDGTYFLAMELMMGETLSSVFRRTAHRVPKDPARHAMLVARVIAEACSGLHAAHELRGADGAPLEVVHRDVSPENVFVTYTGATKVMDFGLACAAHQTHRTRTGIIKGKFSYVAPELLNGFKADRRADVWSLGVVAWELFTGRRLFHRETEAETLAAVTGAQILSPSELRATRPNPIEAPIMRALERDRSRRYQSALEFGHDLLEASLGAARLGDGDVAEWMTELFPDERRRQSQLIELVERLTSFDSTLRDTGSHAVLTRNKASSDPPPPLSLSSGGLREYAGRVLALWRNDALMAVTIAAGLMLAGGALHRSPAAEPTTPRAVQAAVNAPILTPATPPTGAKTPSAPPPRDPQTIELPAGKSYVLEINETSRSGAVLLRIRPESRRTSPSRSAASAPPASLPAPPAWLRDAMARDLH